MTQALAELFEEPTLPEISLSILARLEEEREKRERFYDALDEDKKWEFINGEIVMHSPALNRHNQARDFLFTLIHAFVQGRKLGLATAEKALCTFPRNDYEPDIVFFGREKCRLISGETMKYPVPDLVVEVLSESTEHLDRGIKFRDYEAHGVQEYWIFDPLTEILEQYALREGKLEMKLKSGSGEVVSSALSGFKIPVLAMTDPETQFATLQTIMLGQPGESGP